MNVYVTDAIVSDVGADNFTIQRTPIVRSADDEDRVRNNPRLTVAEGDAIRKFSDNINAVAAQAGASTRITYGNVSLDSVGIQGVSRDYVFFSTFDAERGRLISPTEIDRSRQLCVLGWQTADRLFGPADPLDKVIKIGGQHFASSASARRKRGGVRQLAGRVRDHPLGCSRR
jgi:hypothetical protein